MVRWYLQAWSQGAGTSGFFYFTVADVLRELGVTSIEMLIFALLSGLKRLLCIYFLLLYTELEHGVREGSEGYFGGGNIDPSLTSLEGAASAGSSCHF